LTLDEIPYWRPHAGEVQTLRRNVVDQVARWAFEKFKDAQDKLGTQMRAVGK